MHAPGKITLAKAGTLVGIVGGVVGLIVSYWGSVGWVTPNAYAQDVEDTETQHMAEAAAIVELLQELNSKTATFELRWRCDELTEEMLEIRIEMARLSDRNLRESDAWIAADQRHTNLSEAWGTLGCAEFVE